jgi:hypothetical protein
MSLFVNGPYKQNNGSAITETSTNVRGGAIKMPSASTSQVDAVPLAAGDNLSPVVVGGVNAGQADWSSLVSVSGVSGVGTGILAATGEFSGLARFVRTSHGLVVGNVVNVYNPATGVNQTGVYDGPHRVVGVSNANVFILNTPYVYAETGARYSTTVGDIANQVAGNYSVRGIAARTHGVVDTKLAAAASDYGRNKIHKQTAVRTRKVASAIRNGYWVPASGKFSTKPSQSNDVAGFGTDEAVADASTYGVKGEFAYQYGADLPASGDYTAKTN